MTRAAAVPEFTVEPTDDLEPPPHTDADAPTEQLGEPTSGKRTRGDGAEAKDEKRVALATLIVQLVAESNVQLLADERADAYAAVPRDTHRELLRVRGKAFRSWLAGAVYAKFGRVPNGEALNAGLNVIEAQARGGARVQLWNRVARAQGAIWIDLADQFWRAVRVDGDGWQIVSDPPPLFRRFSHQLPLPEPARGGDARLLAKHLNLASEEDQVLFLASMVAALVPDVPQWIILLHGPQGSAKTTAAKMRRAVIDPSAVPTLIVRRDVGELVQALDHHYAPLLDNLSTISDWQSDLLCQAATGGGFSKRELYSDADDVIFSFRRPLTLTGINVPTAAPDLIDRSLLVHFDRIAPTRRLDDGALWASFEADRPRIFGGLLDALSAAMRRHQEIELPFAPRMIDCARWAAAAADALGYGTEAFFAALRSNAERQTSEVIEGNDVATALIEFAAKSTEWQGTASDLLGALDAARGEKPPPQGWPRRGADLARRLNILSPVLADLGVHLTHGRAPGAARRRFWTVRREP